MKKQRVRNAASNARSDARPKTLIPTLVAVGGSLAGLPVHALELGEIQVSSSLGQPLRASIAYALAPNEALSDSCVSLQRATIGSDLPILSKAAISITGGVISIASTTIIREPLLSMRLNIRCPYTPALSRDYMLFIDPAKPVSETVAAPAAVVTSNRRTAAPAPAAIRRRTATPQPIGDVSRYRVQPGDSLSVIAQRIENRPMGLWDAAAIIFEANPDAFMNNDPNKLKAGSWLLLPDFGAADSVSPADNKVFSGTTSAATGGGSVSIPGAVADMSPDASMAGSSDSAGFTMPAPADAAADAASARINTGVLQAGDAVLDSDNPFVAIDSSTVVIPDTILDAPQATSTSPNVPTAAIQPPRTPATSSTGWFLWLIGCGVAIIAALVLFGRRKRDPYDTTPLYETMHPQRRKHDGKALVIGPVAEPTIEVQELGPIPDDEPTEENLSLDADLAIGSGLSDGGSVNMAQDFGFAATTNLDYELPEEMSSGYNSEAETDVMPPFEIDTQSILRQEVFADGEQNHDEYDMSVILDATKMPRPEDVTERDLEAIAIDSIDDAPAADDYTVSKEVDFNLLEQDYEDEMTATQALNQEIARAAEEIARNKGKAGSGDNDDTAEVSLASVTALDITAEMQANNDDISDLDDTGVNEEIATVNMAEEETAIMSADEKTVEMPRRSGRAGAKRA